MNLTLRPGRLEDSKACGFICYEAFKAISDRHNFPPDFPSPEVATGLLGSLLARKDVYSVVAEIDGKVVGSNFLWENSIAGVGPTSRSSTVRFAVVMMKRSAGSRPAPWMCS